MPTVGVRSADFVREGHAIPVRHAPGAHALLQPRKIKVIMMVSWELLNYSGAEDAIRQVLIESTGPALDGAVFSAAAATPERQAGLLSGVAPLTSTGNLTDDLVALLSVIAPVRSRGAAALMAARPSLR